MRKRLLIVIFFAGIFAPDLFGMNCSARPKPGRWKLGLGIPMAIAAVPAGLLAGIIFGQPECDGCSSSSGRFWVAATLVSVGGLGFGSYLISDGLDDRRFYKSWEKECSSSGQDKTSIDFQFGPRNSRSLGLTYNF